MRGRASGEDLHGWYDAATLFVHPTLYEGSSIVTVLRGELRKEFRQRTCWVRNGRPLPATRRPSGVFALPVPFG